MYIYSSFSLFVCPQFIVFRIISNIIQNETKQKLNSGKMAMETIKERTVHFNPAVKLRLFQMPSRCDREAAWYRSSDFKKFRREKREHIHMIRKMGVEQAEDLSVTSVGIRIQLSPHTRNWREMRQNSRCYLVLQEQYQQYVNDKNDPDAIAGVCKDISYSCSKEALQDALRVQEASNKIYSETSFEGVRWLPPPTCINRMKSPKKSLPMSFCVRQMRSASAA